MGVKLVSASAGSVEIVAPTTASNYTATLPAGTGSIVVNGINSSIVSGTAVASTSGTSIDFTSIPSWVKRITVMLNNVSTNGSSLMQVQLGAGSITTTGYNSAAYTNTVKSVSTTAFLLEGSGNSLYVRSGNIIISSFGSNTWTFLGSWGDQGNSNMSWSGGGVNLGGTLDRVRLTTAGGTDTFDAGSVNILYE